MKRKNMLVAIIIVLLLFIIGIFILLYKNKEKIPKEKDYNLHGGSKAINTKISTRTVLTNKYIIGDRDVNNFKISNMQDLNEFYSLIGSNFNMQEISNEFQINEEDFKDNTIFIMYAKIDVEDSESNFIGVDFTDGEVDFVIDNWDTSNQQNGYYIAIIPNEKLKGKNLEKWNKPSEFKTKYNLTINFNDEAGSLSDTLNLMQDAVSSVGGIILEKFVTSKYYEKFINSERIPTTEAVREFEVSTYDQDKMNELKRICENDSRVKTVFNGSEKKNVEDYDKFLQEINTHNDEYTLTINTTGKLNEEMLSYIKNELGGKVIKNFDDTRRGLLVIEFQDEGSKEIGIKLRTLKEKLKDIIDYGETES